MTIVRPGLGGFRNIRHGLNIENIERYFLIITDSGVNLPRY